MISADKRKAIVVLHEDGMSQGEISRRLKVSPKTIRSIIKQGGGVPNTVRKDKKEACPLSLVKTCPPIKSRTYAPLEFRAEDRQNSPLCSNSHLDHLSQRPCDPDYVSPPR